MISERGNGKLSPVFLYLHELLPWMKFSDFKVQRERERQTEPGGVSEQRKQKSEFGKPRKPEFVGQSTEEESDMKRWREREREISKEL